MNREVSPYTGSKEYSVVIIEDNPELRGFLADRLSSDYDILEADNGPDGLHKPLISMPDLLLAML